MFSGKVESQYLVGSSSHPNRMLTLLGKAGAGHGGTLGRIGNRSTPIRPSKSAHARPSKAEITLTRSICYIHDEVGGAKINILATE
jgi:hypothetical protein